MDEEVKACRSCGHPDSDHDYLWIEKPPGHRRKGAGGRRLCWSKRVEHCLCAGFEAKSPATKEAD